MIREARPGDLDVIERLEEVCFPEPWNRRMIASELAMPDRINLVWSEGDRVSGYALSMRVFEDLHVNKIGVDPDLRRRGIAKELMETTAEIALGHGCEMMSLEVRDTNLSARAFYETLGFTVEYVRRRYYSTGEDALVMSRPIVTRPGRSDPPEARGR